jgi:peptidoglycan/xylan/chitin deacetylase (PgdA/CDA1 family)
LECKHRRCKNPYLNEKTLYVNSLKIKGDKSTAIILMHCNFNNKNTVKVLPIIIEKYKAEGYSFEPITDLTEEYYYKIRRK